MSNEWEKKRIEVWECPNCRRAFKRDDLKWCSDCDEKAVLITRNKRRLFGNFKVVAYEISFKETPVIVLEHEATKERVTMYFSEFFKLIEGSSWSNIRIEENNLLGKKYCYGWRVINKL